MILEHYNFNCDPNDRISYEDEVVWGENFAWTRHALPFNKVPVFSVINEAEIDASERSPPLTIAQSGSIARFASKLVENRSCVASSDISYLTDSSWAAYNDSIFELGQEMCSINPILNCYIGVQFEKMAGWYYDQQLPTFLIYLERQLVSVVIPRLTAGANAASDEVFWGGLGCPSFADFHIFHYLDNAETGRQGCILGVEEESCDFPELQKWFVRMRNLPSMKKYLEDRPRLIGIGTDPGLRDRNGRVVRQREGFGHCWLEDGIFRTPHSVKK